jgi:hypothetical protein
MFRLEPDPRIDLLSNLSDCRMLAAWRAESCRSFPNHSFRLIGEPESHPLGDRSMGRFRGRWNRTRFRLGGAALFTSMRAGCRRDYRPRPAADPTGAGSWRPRRRSRPSFAFAPFALDTPPHPTFISRQLRPTIRWKVQLHMDLPRCAG